MSYALTLFKDTLLNFLEEMVFFFFWGGRRVDCTKWGGYPV